MEPVRFAEALFKRKIDRLTVPEARNGMQSIEVDFHDGSGLVVFGLTVADAWANLATVASELPYGGQTPAFPPRFNFSRVSAPFDMDGVSCVMTEQFGPKGSDPHADPRVMLSYWRGLEAEASAIGGAP